MRRHPSSAWSALGSLAAAFGLLVYLGLGSGLQPEAASGDELTVAETPAPGTPAPTSTPTPTPAPSGSPVATLLPAPGPVGLSADQAIDLIWKGDYDQAERALQVLLRTEADPSVRAEFLVYLAFVASIRNDQEAARTLLRDAIENSPGLALSPVEFPKVLRDMLADIHAQLVDQLPRPQRGSLDSPQHVLAPAATPLAWQGKQKWYRKWYVWAGVAAAVTVAIVVISSGDDEPTPIPTGTPTASPTPTPTEFIFGPEEKFEVPPCDGGATVHIFPFPTPARGNVVVNRATVRLEIQGDYDGIDEESEFVRIRIENNQPLFALNSAQYCSLGVQEEPQSDRVRQQIQAALADGRIEIFVTPADNVDENCVGPCSQSHFHRVRLEFSYSIVP